MKKHGIIIPGIIAILLMVVVISGCTSTTVPYNNSGISFNYSSDWNTPVNANLPSGIGITSNKTKENLTARMDITIQDSNNPLSMWIDSVKAKINGTTSTMNGTLLSEGPVEIAGVQGYRINYNSNDGYEDAEIIFVKNYIYYDIYFSSTSSISAIESDINTVVNSFQTTLTTTSPFSY